MIILSKVFDVPADLLIDQVAADLKNHLKVEQPAWVPFVKTGAHRARAPANPDWYYIRMASILRRVLVDGPVGTESLRTYYGHRKARGSKPHEFRKASGKVVRSCLQALGKLGFVEIDKEKNGRKISGKGESYLQEQSIKAEKRIEEWNNAIIKRHEEKRLKFQRGVNQSAKEDNKGGDKNKGKKKKAESANNSNEEDADPTATRIKRKNK